MPRRASLESTASSSSHHLHHHHHHTARASRAADIARLLDPSYTSAAPAAAAAPAAYVDHHGDLHDPSYRHFPAAPRRAPAPAADADADADDDDSSASGSPDSATGFAPFRTAPARRRRTREAADAYAYSYDSPPTSPEDASALAGDDAPLRCPSRLLRQRRARAASAPQWADELLAEKRPAPVPAPETETDEGAREKHEWTPTCSQALRRQWQGLLLSVRFGVFRTKRRIRRRVSSVL